MNESIHYMGYYDDKGRYMDLYLCCFCQKLPDLKLKEHCRNLHLVFGTSCPHFVQVEDQKERIDKLFEANI